MKIKRWAIYNGISKEYYSKRFVFYCSAVIDREKLIHSYPTLSSSEIESIKIVELT